MIPPLDRAESQHVVGTDPSITDHDKPQLSTLNQEELFRRAVVDRDCAACMRWLQAYAGWVPKG